MPPPHIVTLLTDPARPVLETALVESLRNAWGGGDARWLDLGIAAEFGVAEVPENRWQVWQDLQGMGIDAFGLNCSAGPAEMLPQIKRLREFSRVPLIVKPNAGMPEIVDGKTVYNCPPEQFVELVPEFLKAGVAIFGGCCGTTAEHIAAHLADLGLQPAGVRRFWLHQANIAMNQLIGKRLLGREATADVAPIILDEFANTASAGSIVAFHQHRADLQRGDHGVLCSFGAGYSIGSLVLRKL